MNIEQTLTLFLALGLASPAHAGVQFKKKKAAAEKAG